MRQNILIAMGFVIFGGIGMLIRSYVTNYAPNLDRIWFAAIVTLVFIPLIRIYFIKYCK